MARWLEPEWADTVQEVVEARNTSLGYTRRKSRQPTPQNRRNSRFPILEISTTLGFSLNNSAAGANPMKPNSDPSMVGTGEDVNGANINVKPSHRTPGELLFVKLEGYRTGP